MIEGGSILILGGTTEGRKAAEILDVAGNGFYYSTKEGETEVKLRHGVTIRGAMSVEKMSQFCVDHDIRVLVDAAHPFASVLHATVKEVSDSLCIPVVRFERQYPSPVHIEEIIWADDYDEAIKRIESDEVDRVLVLTGVQSIAKLFPTFQNAGIDSFFRILNRESSINSARNVGVPEDRIVFYGEADDDQELFRKINPDAILLKESGVSGNFVSKADIAVNLGIKVYAIRRPVLPEGFIIVDGPHGFRRAIEELLPDFFPLHTGLTTGTCATAAAIGAALKLFGMIGCGSHHIDVKLPDGEIIKVNVEVDVDHSSVIKDAGSDPDVTDGMRIDVAVAELPGRPGCVIIDGGEGIGRVTLPGLGIEIGEPAINKMPRRMIEENLLRMVGKQIESRGLRVEISSPEGKERAARTFNPRLGIVGGISIIGTSGIVQPFSSKAFVDSIHKSVSVAKATGCNIIVLNSGARSERAVKTFMPDLQSQAFVHYGNFIGDTLKVCNDENVNSIVMGLMIGKAVKLAEGHLNTHSHSVTMNRDFIAGILARTGASEKIVTKAGDLSLARELLQILPDEVLREFSREILRLCYNHCKPLVPHTELRLLLIDENLNIIATFPQ